MLRPLLLFAALLLLPAAASQGFREERLTVGSGGLSIQKEPGLGGVRGTGLSRAELRQVRSHIYAGPRVTEGVFEATAYGPPWNAMQGGPQTSTGISLGPKKKRYLVAIDPDVVQYGNLVRIWPNPWRWRGPFVAADTGGAIQGRRIDFYDWRGRASQYDWGRRDVRLWRYRG